MIIPVQKDLYAVIGNPVAHSLSPVMMNAVFEALNLPAVYLALQVDDIENDLETLAKLGFRGLSVTLPHKEAAFRLADQTDEPARGMGAVNTLRLGDSRWEGRNTDWIGALSALCGAFERTATAQQPGTFPPADESTIAQAGAAVQHDPAPIKSPFELQPSTPDSRQPASLSVPGTHLSFQGLRALVIGAGGVARAVGYGLKREGAALAVTNRGVARGEALAQALACEFFPLSELGRQQGCHAFDLMVQCTSVGLNDEAEFALIPDSFFRPGAVVMDTVYRPLWTPFLRKAQAAGCITVPGTEMLLHQGVAQLQWWFGEQIRAEVVLPIMRRALLRVLTHEKDHP